VDGDQDRIAVVGEGFVDRVVDDLVEHAVQAVDIGVADVHAWRLADSVQSFEHLNV
jgi:hypothetical protein